MGYDLFGAIFFALLTPLVICGFVVFWVMTSQERAHVEDTWESFAARRKREYVPARGEWPNRISPGVRWTANDIVFQLTVIGVEAGARTRLVARPHGRLLGAFTVSAGEARPESVRIDDRAFAQNFSVTERPLGVATRVLDVPVRRALLGFRQRDDVVVHYQRGRVLLEWPGRETSEARIDEAERVVSELVRAIDDAFVDAGRRLAS